MSNAFDKNTTQLVEGLGDEAKFELLEYLAEELGFDLSEQADPVDPQAEIVDLIQGAITNLEADLPVLKAQFVEGAELDYETLDQVSDNIESIVTELLEAHGNLNAFIDSAFDVDEEEDIEDDEE